MLLCIAACSARVACAGVGARALCFVPTCWPGAVRQPCILKVGKKNTGLMMMIGLFALQRTVMGLV